jgi:hypothetical protein
VGAIACGGLTNRWYAPVESAVVLRRKTYVRLYACRMRLLIIIVIIVILVVVVLGFLRRR